MDVSWLHDTVPSKIKSNLNCRCQLTCDDWGIPNTKPKYYQCTSAALLCCKNKQLFNCIWQIITHEWWISIVLFIPPCYKTSFWSGGWFCAFEILVALATNTDLGAVFTQGVCKKPTCHNTNNTINMLNCLNVRHLWWNAPRNPPVIIQTILLTCWIVWTSPICDETHQEAHLS